jgi:hypothetical protein
MLLLLLHYWYRRLVLSWVSADTYTSTDAPQEEPSTLIHSAGALNTLCW